MSTWTTEDVCCWLNERRCISPHGVATLRDKAVNGITLTLPTPQLHAELKAYNLEHADQNQLMVEIKQLKSQAEQQGESCHLN